ncbi:MAG: FGGY family carbohydrate kinase [Actinomycetota bacterium]|nr:FGGY family carbohydrate kinase [Actinomycetota bacterium]
MTIVVGIDVGTSGVKASLVEVREEIAVELRSAAVAYFADKTPCRDPDRWVSASQEALARLELPETVEGIGFSGQMHALVALDDGGRPVQDALLWLDYEGAEPLARFVRAHPEIDLLAETGNVALPDFTLAKWLLLRERAPDAAARVARITHAKDYVRHALCADEWATDWNEASGTQIFDPWQRTWSAAVAAAAELPISLLAPVTEATAETRQPRSRDGAVVSSRCVVGTGDQAAAARGVGASREGIVSLGLGTSGVVAGEIELRVVGDDWDGGFHLFSLDSPELLQIIGTVPSVGPTLAWAARVLRVPIADLGSLASSATSRPGRVLFFPYLGGRGAPHADAAQTGALTGLRESTTDGEIAQAVYVGIALELASVVDEMSRAGAAVREIICSGGPSRDPYLLETIATALEVPCRSASTVNASSVGAALLAYDAIDPMRRPRLASHLVSPSRSPLYTEEWRAMRTALVDQSSFRC